MPRPWPAQHIPLLFQPSPRFLGIDGLAQAFREPRRSLWSGPEPTIRRRLGHRLVQVLDDLRGERGGRPRIVPSAVSESARAVLVVPPDQRAHPRTAQRRNLGGLRHADATHHQQNDVPVATLARIGSGTIVVLDFSNRQVGDNSHRGRHACSGLPPDHPNHPRRQAASSPRPSARSISGVRYHVTRAVLVRH